MTIPAPRILVVRPDRVGDVVVSTPVLQALRHQWPQAYLAMMVRPYTREVLVGNPWLDEIITDDPEGSHSGVRGFLRQVQHVRSRRFDTALMLLPTMRAAWMLFLAGIPRRIGVGHTIYQTMTFTRSVSRRRYIPLRHEADYCLDLARKIGARAVHCRPGIFLTDEERIEAREILQSEGVIQSRLIGIHPGNGHNAPTWTPERFGGLVDHLHQKFGATTIITGSAGERDLCDRLINAANAPIINLVGRLSLRQLMAVLGEIDMLISSSTGPMHVAAALNTPTVSLFCPLPGRSPVRWGPLSEKAENLLPADGECETCEQGPLCDLAGITMDCVLEAVSSQLKRLETAK